MGDHLIPWANKYTKGHDSVRPVENFNDSWADGMAFCALMHTWFPEKVPMAGRTAKTHEEKVANFKLAFDVATENGVERLLDPEDTVSCQDNKSMILYLSYIYDQAKQWPVKWTASAEWIRNYEAAEKQRKFAEWKAKQDSNKPPEPIANQGPSGNVAAKWNPGGSNDSPKDSPKAEVRNSPVDVAGWKYTVTGKGANGGPVNTMLMFTFTLKKDGKGLTDSKKEDLVVHIDAPTNPPRVTVMGGPNGTWQIGFTPCSSGKHWIDFVYRGEFIGEPASLPIGTGDHPYTGKEREEWKAKQV
jgi:hypothetical protein